MAFQELKRYLSHPPIMSSPVVDEVLFAYIAVALYAISLVLIRVDSGIQQPVYYVSKSLNEAEVRYLPLEKTILAIVHATRNFPITSKRILWSYSFNSHSSPCLEVLIILEE